MSAGRNLALVIAILRHVIAMANRGAARTPLLAAPKTLREEHARSNDA